MLSEFIMKFLKFGVFILFGIFLLTGCDTTKKVAREYGGFGQYDDYKKAEPHDKPLSIPNDLKSDAIEDHYSVPRIDDAKEIHSSVLPPGSKVER